MSENFDSFEWLCEVAVIERLPNTTNAFSFTLQFLSYMSAEADRHDDSEEMDFLLILTNYAPQVITLLGDRKTGVINALIAMWGAYLNSFTGSNRPRPGVA